MALVLTLLATLLLAGTALAAAKPGKPTAKTPVGTATTTTPTFKWSKAARATKYELRVYQGSTQKLKKAGLTKLSYKAVKALPANVTLTWKVRASNARGAGAWSKSLTFKVVSLAVGDPYQGGIVGYILASGDPGYVAGETHGLIAAAAADQMPYPPGIQWATEPYWGISVPGALGTAIGSGAANTDAIIAQNGPGTTYAAGLARAYNGGGYGDWYLPSKDELNQLYLNRVAIGGFDTTTGPWYWSSSESEGYTGGAWYQNFVDGHQGNASSKFNRDRVRAVRAF
jgi:hypothetical protein